ncbi:unnamed protein product [Lymnaea stagnalis]|uniref:Serine/threonine-protein phosphatase 4 regulatory subunit 2 n=1 Tax=Lymnaea stagnalis TaxID=6523 RepID=A0AAV2HZL4_LYMST
MDNKEDYLDALTAYSRNPTPEIPPILEQYLNGVAKNGETLFHWQLLKPLIVGKMEKVIGELKKGLSSEIIPTRPNVENVRFEVMHGRIMESLQKFNGAPFTIQRLCELLIDPKQHYKRSDKFMRGLEKNVLVVSTVDPFGKKIVSESVNKHLVNGMDTNGSPFFPRDSNISSNLPPVPGWVTSAVTVPPRNTSSPNLGSFEDQKPTQVPPQDANLTTNGVASGLVSSLYTDNGEQPLAVHAEEVVEETIVTMDPTEVGPVATDGGEAMAEDEEEEEIGGDDTNASSTSSSSSSSEDLSPSDAVESTTESKEQVSPRDSSIRPWASIANVGENKKEINAIVANSESNSENCPDVCTSESSKQLTPAKACADLASPSPQPSDSLDQSFGFEPTALKNKNENKENLTTDISQQVSKSVGVVSSESAVADQVNPDAAEEISPESQSHVRTYAEVAASASRISEVEPIHNSVAGLERLVDSVETKSLPARVNISQSLPLITQSDSPSSSLDSDEPRAKRFKFSNEPSTTSEVPVTELVASSSELSTLAEPDLPLSDGHSLSSDITTSVCDDRRLADTTNGDAALPDIVTSNRTSEQTIENLTDVSCSSEDAESLTSSSVELGGGDTVGQSREDLTSSPPSHLSSSSDSQGFDVCGDTLRKTNEKQDESVSEEEISSQP